MIRPRLEIVLVATLLLGAGVVAATSCDDGPPTGQDAGVDGDADTDGDVDGDVEGDVDGDLDGDSDVDRDGDADEPEVPMGTLPETLTPGSWELTWNDEFAGDEGALPAPHWFFFDGWEDDGVWRDAHYASGQEAFLDGEGHLALRASLVGEELHTAYLQTYDWSRPLSEWTTFGPGDGRYIEARMRLDELESGGLWTAFWLFDPSGTYDGDPSTGTEIDIMENIVAYGAEGSWIADLPGGTSLNHVNVATHWGESVGELIDASTFGVDLRDGHFHTFGLEWHTDRLVYYMDGQEIWRTDRGVSTSDGEALILSIEYDEGPGDAWEANESVLDYADQMPDRVLVDHVRVYSRR